MKRIRYQGGGAASIVGVTDVSRQGGNVIVTVPSGSQITYIRVVPGVNPVGAVVGTWFSLNEGGPLFLTIPFCIDSDVLGYCCERDLDMCDRYPGDVQISIKIGLPAQPEDAERNGPVGVAADEWEVFYIEGVC